MSEEQKKPFGFDPQHPHRFRPDPLAQPAVEIMEPETSEINGNSALAFLQAVYRSVDQPMHRRMRAADAALAYESPKQATSAGGLNKGFADGLERVRNRSAAPALIIDNTAADHIDPLPAEPDTAS